MATLIERLQALDPQLDWGQLGTDAGERLERFAEACPLYARAIERHPDWALWLEDAENLRTHHGFHALLANWNGMRAAHGSPTRDAAGYPGLLRRFRRKMSMRIAYRDVADIAPTAEIVDELTRLAEFCVRECLFCAKHLWSRRLGDPWDEAIDGPARFCVIGLGKLGGQELNFSSDIDLIYLYEGEGHTRRDGRTTSTTNGEYFHRVGETITHLLNQRDGFGFLFRTDLRLRPGGATAPLVPSLEATESYYAATGQTWERLALIKARPVAGNFGLGSELLESLQSFLYPRHPPPSLLSEVAAMKHRTEREIVGAEALGRDVKSGFGGIREIEFFAQSMQLLHAGRYPFLQTHSTISALDQLVRYGLLESPSAKFLEETYWLLRRIEHRVQMAEEKQTHALPADPVERASIASSLGFSDLVDFDSQLASRRRCVREIYSGLFGESASAASELAEDWWSFFANGRVSEGVREMLKGWFGGADEATKHLRRFVHESETRPLLRDQVRRFTDIIPELDRVLSQLASPIQTLGRISSFGERYATRAQFLSACAVNRDFFTVLALLFDRSRFIHELLCRHPEILDEVLRPEILRKQKELEARLRELRDHPGGRADAFASWLWLYVRAEQVRAAIGQLLGIIDIPATSRELASLAESVLLDLLRRIGSAENLMVVALGKFGGGELTFGSDLDVLFLAADDSTDAAEPTVRAILKRLAARDGRDAIFQLDLRLRPHGETSPIVAGIGAYAEYFRKSARLWERQTLTRAWVLAGPASLVAQWDALIKEIVYAQPLSGEEADELWHMRLRIQHERDRVQPTERAFKTGPGGLIDIEFALQILQLAHVHEVPQLQTPDLRTGWTRAGRAGIVSRTIVERLLDCHLHLSGLEFALRRNSNRSETTIPADEHSQAALAKWLGYPDRATFWHEHCGRMRETRRLATGSLEGIVDSTELEGHR
ncbi:MAG TPA: bifunctional [glutamate--ammonia ligase]-adenylyl-L-tyrosine phosphorylase/[glutamate--ammonia-ligase] adenylyltransferase [Opitutaceae bacterium]